MPNRLSDYQILIAAEKYCELQGVDPQSQAHELLRDTNLSIRINQLELVNTCECLPTDIEVQAIFHASSVHLKPTNS